MKSFNAQVLDNFAAKLAADAKRASFRPASKPMPPPAAAPAPAAEPVPDMSNFGAGLRGAVSLASALGSSQAARDAFGRELGALGRDMLTQKPKMPGAVEESLANLTPGRFDSADLGDSTGVFGGGGQRGYSAEKSDPTASGAGVPDLATTTGSSAGGITGAPTGYSPSSDDLTPSSELAANAGRSTAGGSASAPQSAPRSWADFLQQYHLDDIGVAGAGGLGAMALARMFNSGKDDEDENSWWPWLAGLGGAGAAYGAWNYGPQLAEALRNAGGPIIVLPAPAAGAAAPAPPSQTPPSA